MNFRLYRIWVRLFLVIFTVLIHCLIFESELIDCTTDRHLARIFLSELFSPVLIPERAELCLPSVGYRLSV